jgi:hypothetical protein
MKCTLYWATIHTVKQNTAVTPCGDILFSSVLYYCKAPYIDSLMWKTSLLHVLVLPIHFLETFSIGNLKSNSKNWKLGRMQRISRKWFRISLHNFSVSEKKNVSTSWINVCHLHGIMVSSSDCGVSRLAYSLMQNARFNIYAKYWLLK